MIDRLNKDLIDANIDCKPTKLIQWLWTNKPQHLRQNQKYYIIGHLHMPP